MGEKLLMRDDGGDIYSIFSFQFILFLNLLRV